MIKVGEKCNYYGFFKQPCLRGIFVKIYRQLTYETMRVAFPFGYVATKGSYV